MSSHIEIPNCKYSFRAKLRVHGLDHAARVDFFRDSIELFYRRFHFLRDNDYALLQRVSYADVQHCEFVPPSVGSGSTFTGFVWGNIPGAIEMSIFAPPRHKRPRVIKRHRTRELVRFTGEGMTEAEFNSMCAWLRTRLLQEAQNTH